MRVSFVTRLIFPNITLRPVCRFSEISIFAVSRCFFQNIVEIHRSNFYEPMREKELNYKDYVNPRPIVPQGLGHKAHGIYTNTLNG